MAKPKVQIEKELRKKILKTLYSLEIDMLEILKEGEPHPMWESFARLEDTWQYFDKQTEDEK